MTHRALTLLAFTMAVSPVHSSDSWVKRISISKMQAGECESIHLRFSPLNGKVKRYTGLYGEALILEKQNRVIVVPTCPQISPEYLYFFDSTGQQINRLEIKYGGISEFHFDERSQCLVIRFGKYNPSSRTMVEMQDSYNMNGKLISSAPFRPGQ
jgi:hypothetical protein